jgi:hypothetical protein
MFKTSLPLHPTVYTRPFLLRTFQKPRKPLSNLAHGLPSPHSLKGTSLSALRTGPTTLHLGALAHTIPFVRTWS